MFSAFNPSKWSSGQPTLWRLGGSWGFGALLKGLTSVVDNSCRSRDSNPQPRVTSGFKSNTLGHDIQDIYVFLSSVKNKLRFLMKTFQDLSPYSELQWTPNGLRSK